MPIHLYINCGCSCTTQWQSWVNAKGTTWPSQPKNIYCLALYAPNLLNYSSSSKLLLFLCCLFKILWSFVPGPRDPVVTSAWDVHPNCPGTPNSTSKTVILRASLQSFSASLKQNESLPCSSFSHQTWFKSSFIRSHSVLICLTCFLSAMVTMQCLAHSRQCVCSWNACYLNLIEVFLLPIFVSQRFFPGLIQMPLSPGPC